MLENFPDYLSNFWHFPDQDTFFGHLIFFKRNLFQKPSECQTSLIQIRFEVLSDLIWVNIVCKDYQQTAPGGKPLISQLTAADIKFCDIFLWVWGKIRFRDFPRPDLGPNNSTFPIQKWAKTSQNVVYLFFFFFIWFFTSHQQSFII